MSANTSDPVTSLEQANSFLDRMASDCETTVAALVEVFQILSGQVSELLQVAGLTVDSVRAQGVDRVPATVEKLVEATEHFIRMRFEATSAVLETVKNEQKLLDRLLRLNAANRCIAQEVRMLGLLTCIEVAQLGEEGSGFEYLARELQTSSDGVASSTLEFAGHAASRATAVHECQRNMARALPRLLKQFEGTRAQLQQALASVKLSVDELSACPEQFKAGVETVFAHISGVVSAIQSHDITRQQAEHVRDALDAMREMFRGSATPDLALRLKIQLHQLKNIQQTMDAWSSQVEDCLESILTVSHNRLACVAPVILNQEKELSQRLLEVEQLERECEKDSGEVEEALSGLASLMLLVGEHFAGARMVRDRLQLLSFNSIIEATNLGSKADVMLEISRNITRVSTQWGEMTGRSEKTRMEIQALLDHAQAEIRSLDHEGGDVLESARKEIESVLGALRTAAQCARDNAVRIGELTSALHDGSGTLRSLSRSLKALSGNTRKASLEIEAIIDGIEIRDPPAASTLESLEAECSSLYTTEIERRIVRAVLYGEDVPSPDSAIVGNDVELF